MSEILSHWCKGKIVDSNGDSKWILRCEICKNIFEGVTSHSVGPYTKGPTIAGNLNVVCSKEGEVI